MRQLDEALEASTYGYRNDHESEAELESKAFLSQLGTFVEAIRRAPARMSLLASKLTRTIEEASPENRSMDDQEILARARYIQKQILPAVLENVSAKVDSEPTSRAVDLLATLSGDTNNPRVRDAFIKVATTPNGNYLTAIDGLKKMGIPTALSALSTIVEQTIKPQDAYKRQHLIKEMLEMSGNRRGSQDRALVEWGQPNSSIRDAAREYLKSSLQDWFISNDGIMSRPVSDDYMMLPPDGQRSTAVRARYTLDHGDDFQKRVAAIKLGMHGKADDIPRLMQAATHPDINIASAALRSGLRLTTGNKHAAMIDHLDRFALSSSPLHPAARQLFDQMHGDDHTDSYRQLFGVINDPHYFMPARAAQILSQLPANSRRAEWIQELIGTINTGASHHPDIAASNRQEFLDAVAKTIPDLRKHGPDSSTAKWLLSSLSTYLQMTSPRKRDTIV